jgi:ATP-dependent Clp protease ATP-binding subunit ClpA
VFKRFTERARHVVVLAQEEARALEHPYIGTEHILLGLLREEEGVARRVLAQVDVGLEEVRAEVVRIVGRGESAPEGQVPFTPRAKKVLELALREALALGHSYIGTEHVLLGLVRENDGVAAQILEAQGATADRIETVVADELGVHADTFRPQRFGRGLRRAGRFASVGRPRTCWEYRIERRDHIDTGWLNELGADGWELVSVDRSPEGAQLIFKRRGSMPGSLRVAG